MIKCACDCYSLFARFHLSNKKKIFKDNSRSIIAYFLTLLDLIFLHFDIKRSIFSESCNLQMTCSDKENCKGRNEK